MSNLRQLGGGAKSGQVLSIQGRRKMPITPLPEFGSTNILTTPQNVRLKARPHKAQGFSPEGGLNEILRPVRSPEDSKLRTCPVMAQSHHGKCMTKFGVGYDEWYVWD